MRLLRAGIIEMESLVHHGGRTVRKVERRQATYQEAHELSRAFISSSSVGGRLTLTALADYQSRQGRGASLAESGSKRLQHFPRTCKAVNQS